MNLTEHFSIEEMTRTTHAEFQEINRLLAASFMVNMKQVCGQLELIRDYFARPIFITSGFRCPGLNDAIGGSATSQHMRGEAADFVVKDFQDETGLGIVFDWCGHHLNYGQLIFERPTNRKPWIHIGLPHRPIPANHLESGDGRHYGAKRGFMG